MIIPVTPNLKLDIDFIVFMFLFVWVHFNALKVEPLEIKLLRQNALESRKYFIQILEEIKKDKND